MKAKTKIEIAVKALEPQLPELTDKQKKYADDKFFNKLCYATKNTAWCLECGSDIEVKLIINEKVDCPTCQLKLKVERTRKRNHYTQFKMFAFASVLKDEKYDFQITRCFEIRCYYRKGKEKFVVCFEVNQRWYDKDSKKTVVNSRIENAYSGNYNGDLEIRKDYHNYKYYSGNSYDPQPWFFLPDSKFRPDLVKIGVTPKRLEDIKFSMLMDRIHKSPKIETLLKRGLTEIIEKWSAEEIAVFWPALRICFRNNYKIKHVASYKDYLDALFYLDKDLHNPHYVCPEDFVKAHDHYISLKTKKRLLNSALTEAEKIKLATPKYEKEKKKFLHLNFTSGKISIAPLQSVEDFYIEGTFFKHCIFQNSYFDKKNSLLFSARYDGVRMETFELSLSTFKILQSHGMSHTKSKYSKKMEELILNNISQVKKCMEPYKLKRNKKEKIAS